MSGARHNNVLLVGQVHAMLKRSGPLNVNQIAERLGCSVAGAQMCIKRHPKLFEEAGVYDSIATRKSKATRYRIKSGGTAMEETMLHGNTSNPSTPEEPEAICHE